MCACMPFFPSIVSYSPILQICMHSIHSLGSWTIGSSHYTFATNGRKRYQQYVSRDGSVEGGLELHGRETSTNAILPESPRKTPRMELGAFEVYERPRSSYVTQNCLIRLWGHGVRIYFACCSDQYCSLQQVGGVRVQWIGSSWWGLPRVESWAWYLPCWAYMWKKRRR